MADPFDVAPPQWLTNLVGRPVDMGAVGTAVGGALSRRFNPPSQEDQFMSLRRARMGAEIEQIRSHAALQTSDALLKTHLLQQKTEADLQTSQWVAQHSADYQSILNADVPSNFNSTAVDNIWKLKNQASLFGNRLMQQQRETGWNKAMIDLGAKNADPAIAGELATLHESVGQDGWTPENRAALNGIQQRSNVAIGAGKLDYQQRLANLKLDAQKQMAGIRQDNALDRLWQKHQDQLDAIDVSDANAVARLNQGFKNSLELLKQKQAGVEVVETFKGQEAQAAKTHTFSPNEPATPEIPGRRVKKTVVAGSPYAPESSIQKDVSPAAKAAEANKISIENPKWTRQQVLDEVAKRLSQ